MNLPIIRYRRFWYVCSLALFAAGIVLIAIFGLRFGIDFTGGTLVGVHFENDRPSTEDVRTFLAGVGYPNAIVQPVGERETVMKLEAIDESAHRTLVENLTERFGNLREDRFEVIGPTIGNELRRKSIWSVLLIVLTISLYVAFVFRKVAKPVASWKYGVITVAALVHDVF